MTWSMICSADWPAIGAPQLWQCGWPDPRPQQPQVVVDLRDGPTVERGLREVVFWSMEIAGTALDRVDVRLVHLPEELARVRAQRLDVAALALA
jgi:hypothetical protein